MSSIADLVDPAFKYFILAEMTAKYLALIALIIGAIGYFTIRANGRRHLRYRGMFVGGGMALVAIFSLNAVYDLLAWVMGPQFLPPGWPYGAIGMSGVVPLAQAASGMLHYLGLGCFSVGVAFWAMGSPRGRTWTTGYRGIVWGLTMIAVSMGGQLFSVFAAILA